MILPRLVLVCALLVPPLSAHQAPHGPSAHSEPPRQVQPLLGPRLPVPWRSFEPVLEQRDDALLAPAVQDDGHTIRISTLALVLAVVLILVLALD